MKRNTGRCSRDGGNSQGQPYLDQASWQSGRLAAIVRARTANSVKPRKNCSDLKKTGIREYKSLAKESSGYYNGLFKVLLDGMIRDSEKHVELLEFLRENLKHS